MNTQNDSSDLDLWSEVLAGVVTTHLRLFKAPYDLGFEMLEEALRMPRGLQAPFENSGQTRQGADEFCGIEALARERASKGLALPKQIYRSPHRERVDWASFPPWARPIDPEIFQGCGHEG